jgi:Flp pilus assembly protein TadG
MRTRIQAPHGTALNLRRSDRRAAAAVELAVLLPFLVFIFLIATDWARIFYYSVIIENCARQGAIYQMDALAQTKSPYADLSHAALADASDLSPQPTVSSGSGTDATGNAYVTVTVTWTFNTVTTNFPGIPSTVILSRTVEMRTAPTTPK